MTDQSAVIRRIRFSSDADNVRLTNACIIIIIIIIINDRTQKKSHRTPRFSPFFRPTIFSVVFQSCIFPLSFKTVWGVEYRYLKGGRSSANGSRSACALARLVLKRVGPITCTTVVVVVVVVVVTTIDADRATTHATATMG